MDDFIGLFAADFQSCKFYHCFNYYNDWNLIINMAYLFLAQPHFYSWKMASHKFNLGCNVNAVENLL